MKKILVIDDEDAVRSFLTTVLEREGFFVITAGDGREGMKKIGSEPVDLVITDLIMPEKEGMEIIMEVKKIYPHIPVIAISGGGRNSPESYLNTAKLLGAKAILEKPFHKEKLLSTIQAVLS